MVSLIIVPPIFIMFWLATAWATARAARAVGSTRGQIKWGMVVVLITFVIALADRAISPGPPTAPPDDAAEKAVEDGGPLWPLIVAAAELGAMFFVIKFVFRLSAKRTFAPFAANLAMSFLQLGILLLIVMPFVFETFRIPTASMSPTIEPGDRVIVEKLLAPRRWDLVAYRTEGPEPLIYCKRLIGLPGEELRFADGNLFVDNQPLTPPAVLAGRLHASLSAPGYKARYSDGETISLAGEECFFIGDNVDASKDSRFDGPAHREAIIGVVDLLYWPLGRARIFR